jgi:hypothetical protein
VRNTAGANAWDRVAAWWSPHPPPESSTGGALTFESIDGRRLFLLNAYDGEALHTAADGWVPYRRIQGYPADAPDAPDAPFLLVVRAIADDDRDREDFRRWLLEEHGPRQTSIPGVRWLHAYEQEGPEHSFLNLWGIDEPAIVNSDDWIEVRRSPWWDRVAHVPANADRGVYRRVSREPIGRAR